MVMVGESAAAIIARQSARSSRGPRAVLICGALAGLTLLVAVAVVSRPKSVPMQGGASASVAMGSDSAARAAAARGALAAYRGYQLAYAAAGQSPDPFDRRLEEYAGDPALAEVQITLQKMAENGVAYRGVFKDRILVTNISLATQTVSLMNCQDISALMLVDKKTGKVLPFSSQNLRFPVTVQARSYQGRWIIVNASADRSKRC